jgi:G:T/U-mismatch repair DNA glycosylase
MKQQYLMEHHPWNWYVPKGAYSVIIGTFPPPCDNWSYDFFSPDPNDLFWPILSKIARHELQYFEGLDAVDERKAILDQLVIGIVDMGKSIFRKRNQVDTANQHVLKYMDILKMLDTNPSIRRLIFTSSSGKVNAARWFRDYLYNRGIICRLPSGGRPLIREIELLGKVYKVILLDQVEFPSGRPLPFEMRVRHLRDAI